MHSIVTTLTEADIKVKVANFCAAMDALIDHDDKILFKPSKMGCQSANVDGHF